VALVALAVFATATSLAAAPRRSAHPGALPPPPPVEARSWALIDARNGEMITSHAAKRRLPIASTTKLMTAWVVLHKLALNKVVRAHEYIPTYGESLLGLRTGQPISIHDLLYGMILVSGNDAAYDLALATAGTEARFVREMNAQARRLHLRNTHYANPIGLDQRGNYSSAHDLAMLARRLLGIPTFARIADSRHTVLRSLRPPRPIASINQLLHMAPWVTGVKTGHTEEARFVLVGSGRLRGVELIAVAIGAPTDEARFSDDLSLLRYGFSLYRRRLVVRAGQPLFAAHIRYAGGTLPLLASRSVRLSVRRAQPLRVAVRAPAEVEGPIRRGAVLGHALVYLGGWQAARVTLRAAKAVGRASELSKVKSFVMENAIPIVPGVFVILIGAGTALLWRRRRRGRRRGVFG
jgi:D-alanyl-D-alanine carboxypeptidase (penicillin-binding protein 5/6)